MKSSSFLFSTLFLLILAACQPTDGPDDPKNEDPLPGELTAKSSSVFMRAQLNGQSWEAEFVQSKQSNGTDSKGEYHIFTLIGREGAENSDPMLSIGLTRYEDGPFAAATYDIKEFWTNASDKYAGNLLYDAETLYSLDLNDPETYASFTINSINGNKISGSFSMKLRAFNGDYMEFTNGSFESDNYTE
ncbi:MAG: hypothetical protein AAFN10_06920 [Bacteroidota bacterium]